ncbi:MAG: glutathione synthase [Wenzhouxiangellaceae bacterium]
MTQRDLLFVMDPLERIKPYKDSTMAMMLEAQRRGHRVWYAQQHEMSLRDNQLQVIARQVELFDRNQDWFHPAEDEALPATRFDAVFMRKDPPFNMAYVYSTYLLEAAERCGVRIINKPSALRDANEKLAATWFPQCIPPTLVSSDPQQIKAFVGEQQHTVLKPLDGMGGTGIFQARAGEPNLNSIIETLTDNGQELIMVQRYIDQISAGDKRILLVNGKAVDYALARIPPADDFRGNLARGGTGKAVPLSDRDRWIADQVGPELVRRGILFAGLDVIGDYLTEINVTSPTCIRELDQAHDLNIAGLLFDALEDGWT